MTAGDEGWNRTGDATGWAEFVETLDHDGAAYGIAKAALEGPTMRWTIRRDRIEPGRTISRAALNETVRQMTAFIEGRVLEAWERRKEPPLEVDIDLTVDAH